MGDLDVAYMRYLYHKKRTVRAAGVIYLQSRALRFLLPPAGRMPRLEGAGLIRGLYARGLQALVIHCVCMHAPPFW